MKSIVRSGLGLLTLSLVTACATTGPAQATRTQPVAVETQRTFDRVDTTAKGLEDFFAVGTPTSPVHTDRKTGILTAAYLMVELGLDTRLSPEAQARFAQLLLADLPTGDGVKEIVVPQFAPAKAGAEAETAEKDLYLFLAETKDRSGKPVYKLQTNLPISSNYSPGIYDGYEVAFGGKLFQGMVPKAWVAIFQFPQYETKLTYSGISMPRVGSPLVAKDDSIGSDRQLSVTVADGPQVAKAIQDINAILKSVSETVAGETDAKKLASMKRLQKMGTLSTSLYTWISGDLTSARALLKEAQGVELDPPKVPRLDNATRLSAVLECAFAMDTTIATW